MRQLLGQIERILQGPAGLLPVEPVRHALPRLLGFTLLLGGLYGAAMGTYGGLTGERAAQVWISAAKVPLLLLATFAISLPSFFVLNTLLGVREDFGEALRGLVSAQAGLTAVLASLAPYTLLWYASFDNYHNAVLFNGLMFAIATFTAQWLLRQWYRPLIARRPRHRLLLGVWLVLYSFVGIQMAWVLRPFVGMPGTPVQFFREEAWGNAYVVVGRMIWRALMR